MYAFELVVDIPGAQYQGNPRNRSTLPLYCNEPFVFWGALVMRMLPLGRLELISRTVTIDPCLITTVDGLPEFWDEILPRYIPPLKWNALVL